MENLPDKCKAGEILINGDCFKVHRTGAGENDFYLENRSERDRQRDNLTIQAINRLKGLNAEPTISSIKYSLWYHWSETARKDTLAASLKRLMAAGKVQQNGDAYETI